MRVGVKMTVSRALFEDTPLNVGFIRLNTVAVQHFEIRNDFQLPFAYKGSNFSVVVPEESSLLVSITIRADQRGPLNYREPVTTNMTPPFYLNVTGEVVPVKLRFMGDDGKRKRALVFGSEILLLPTKRVVLYNAGKTIVDIDSISHSGRLFSYRSNCPPNLGCNESCEINVSIALAKFRRPLESGDLLVVSGDKENSLKLVIELSDSEIDSVILRRRLKTFFVVCLAMSWIVVGIWKEVREFARKRKEIYLRLKNLDRAIDRLSVWAKVSIGTQVLRTSQKVTGGTWSVCASNTKEVSQETIRTMDMMLSNYV
jgi:hypothetical protein